MKQGRPRVQVVAAVVRRGGTVLVTQRRAEADRGGLWEFPGGKLEPGESDAEALRREIREELGCGIEVGRLLARHAHRYPDLHVELAFYACTVPGGEEPRAIGVAALAWAAAGTLETYAFCEADVPVLPLIERELAASVAGASW